jgi:hypothetical protein
MKIGASQHYIPEDSNLHISYQCLSYKIFYLLAYLFLVYLLIMVITLNYNSHYTWHNIHMHYGFKISVYIPLFSSHSGYGLYSWDHLASLIFFIILSPSYL